MFATDLTQSQVLRVTGVTNTTYNTTVWATLPAGRLLGLSPVPNKDLMYVVGQLKSSSSYALWTFSTTEPNSFQQEVVLDAVAGNDGNGLGVDVATGKSKCVQVKQCHN